MGTLFFITISTFSAKECPSFLSPKWFRDRSDISLAALHIERELEDHDPEKDEEFGQINHLYLRVTQLLGNTQSVLQAIRLADENPLLIAKAKRWAARALRRLKKVEAQAQLVKNSELRIANSRASRRALERYDLLQEAFKRADDMAQWKTELPRRALRALSNGNAALLHPAVFVGVITDDPNFIARREARYGDIFKGWDQLSSSIFQLEHSKWNVHFCARSWIRARLLKNLLDTSILQSKIDRGIWEPRNPGNPGFFDMEDQYLGRLALDTQLALTLIERIVQDLRSVSERPEYAEVLDREWQKAKAAAEVFLAEIQKTRGDVRLVFEDPYTTVHRKEMIENPQPEPHQLVYLDQISAITSNIAKELSPSEIAGEALRRFQRIARIDVGPLAHWTTCREVIALVRSGLRRIEIAENLGLYDGHGTDPDLNPRAQDSVVMGLAQVQLERINGELRKNGCLKANPGTGF
jgi:hypothetical protein